jgi:hypothetical protein
MSLTIGIPSRGSNSSLHRVIRHALTLDVQEILVGINPNGECCEDLSTYSDSRLLFFFHPKDIGLYGNFRFLSSRSKHTFFAWLCTDDLLSPHVPQMLKSFQQSTINLIIPTWHWAEYKPHESAPFDLANQTPGTYPNLKSKSSTVDSALLHCEPSWMFGIWRTSFLKKNFPLRNFDWLDTHLLQRVLLSRSVKVVELPEPTLIGTWHWANKIPASVSKKGHSPVWAVLYQLTLLPRILWLSPKGILRIPFRIRFLFWSSREMNRRQASFGER